MKLKFTAEALRILKDSPAKRMDCPYCEQSVYALPSNLTEDGKMFDWSCQECGEPIEPVILPRGVTLEAYLRKGELLPVVQSGHGCVSLPPAPEYSLCSRRIIPQNWGSKGDYH